jgi:hypothetical protein
VRLAGTHRDACPDGGEDTDEYLWASPGWVVAAPDDRDGDGAPWHADCDDADPAVRPGADDVSRDGVDHDCDGRDEPADADADGVPWPRDCDDADPGVHPLAQERPCDGVDQDCDGSDGMACDDDTSVEREDDAGASARPEACGCGTPHDGSAHRTHVPLALALLTGVVARRPGTRPGRASRPRP